MSTTTPAPSQTSQTPPAPKKHFIGGVLPFIGVILFTIVTIIQFVSPHTGDQGPIVVHNAVTYLIGWAGLGAGIAHLFFGKRISSTIGFEKSPYEFEVGFADLAFGIVGLMAASFSMEFSLAVILVSSIYRVGCGFGHIRSMIVSRNFAPNNTTILFTNFVVPAFLLIAYFAWA